MSPASLRKAFEDALLSFVWRQWGQLGVSAHFRRPDSWCQDPEALLIFSLEVTRREPRMFDEILDWIHANPEALMRQRLQNLLTQHANDWDLLLVSAALKSAGASPLVPERVLRDAHPESASKGVFEGQYAGLGDVERLDEAFARHGLRRPPFKRSKKGGEPSYALPINFAFRMRALFGPSTRAEALRCLLLRPGREHGTAELAGLTGLSRVGIHQAVDAMARAGACEMRQKGRKDLTWWVDETKWWDLLQVKPEDRPTFVDWPPVYRGLIALWRWLQDPQRETESSYLRASRARELAEDVSPLLSNRGLPTFFLGSGDLRGEQYWPAFEGGVLALAAYLEGAPFLVDEPFAGTHPVFIKRFLKRRFPWIADVEVYAAPFHLYYRLSVAEDGPMAPDSERAKEAIEPFRLMALRVDVGLEAPTESLEQVEIPEGAEPILLRSNPTPSGVIDALNRFFPKARFVGIKEDFEARIVDIQQAVEGKQVSQDDVAQAFRWLLPWSPFLVRLDRVSGP